MKSKESNVEPVSKKNPLLLPIPKFQMIIEITKLEFPDDESPELICEYDYDEEIAKKEKINVKDLDEEIRKIILLALEREMVNSQEEEK